MISTPSTSFIILAEDPTLLFAIGLMRSDNKLNLFFLLVLFLQVPIFFFIITFCSSISTSSFLSFFLFFSAEHVYQLSSTPSQGVDFRDFYDKLFIQISQLEKGMTIELHGEQVSLPQLFFDSLFLSFFFLFKKKNKKKRKRKRKRGKKKKVQLIAGIAVSTSDLPQGNDKASIKRQSADHGCRRCKESRNELYDLDKDPKLRTHDEILETRKKISQAGPQEKRSQLEQETGVLEKSSPFEVLSFDIGLNIHLPAQLLFFFFFFFSLRFNIHFYSPPIHF